MVGIVTSSLPFIELRDTAVMQTTKDNLIKFILILFCGATCLVIATILGNIASRVDQIRNPRKYQERQDRSNQAVGQAWTNLMNCCALKLERQESFVHGLGHFDRRLVYKLAALVETELVRSGGTSRRSNRRVSMQSASVEGLQRVQEASSTVKEAGTEAVKPAAQFEF
jgi:hypothetical protein